MNNKNPKYWTHCKYGHEFTKDSTCFQIKNGKKYKRCRTCKNEKQILYRKINHDKWENKYRPKQKVKYLRKKLQVISYYSPKLNCQCCGEAELNFLSIDHINNDGYRHKKENNNLKGGTPMYYWIIRNNFPKGFQVLCMNCNFGKRMNDGVCPHKTMKKTIPITLD